MAQYELLLPKMGESVAEATVIKWLKQPGDMISLDDTLLEIATDKVDSEVPSPVAGKLIKQLYKEDEVVQVGAVIALIETDAVETEPAQTEEKPVAAEVAPEAEAVANIPGTAQLNDVPVSSGVTTESDRFYSPLVKSIAAQEQISVTELDQITGSGADGRLTKDDLLNYIQNGRKSNGAVFANRTQSQPAAEAPVNNTPAPAPVAAAKSSNAQPVVSVSGADEIIEMDRMGKIIADHMVMSKQTSAHVTSFVEADVTNMVLWRDKVKKNFEKRENEKITFTPIFIEAVTKAIKDFPMINVSVNGTKIIKKKDINIGMAAALPSGNLIVPVIKNADQLNLVGLTKSVNDLANRARGSKLKPDETQGGTFTLTNVGSFGNVMGTPIINQPQVAILAVGAIKKKPAVLETEYGDVIAIRHMMFLSLSYDHRVVNGALGGTFVRRVADYLENWDINREI
ncbi:2-oxoglutarate dehydrogenase E2 component (dihydrolipoamide succinyltransferase) [Pedobacter cryoconitis]|uniref:dihydrolipoamide acetyltransferase family protein n=1 Tax=Pedobacter cryoconitis TaxID=188932 RepID=UPI00162237BE|nr:dihydrolipoamide acetyltransferase family protein [Pedobacter cryoconitis]MBB6271395.1 2-oxoglutarate dehydrogenase E2 component (dihydrolipoamide succinyltransferase) [Pedobacter cryoconitis]